jgi:hypothetical protein
MSNRKYSRDQVVRAATRLVKMSAQLDPVVAAAARKALDRLRMLPMSEILDKVPGEQWVDKAKAIGVTRETIYGWLKGRCRPYPQQAQRLAEITGFDADEIRGLRST